MKNKDFHRSLVSAAWWSTDASVRNDNDTPKDTKVKVTELGLREASYMGLASETLHVGAS